MKGWIIGAGVAAVAVGAGAATWTTVSFLSGGPQAAEAFPSDTLAMVSIDLDPSASQKIAAFKLANRFPSLKDDLGLHSGDDLRRKLVESLSDEAGCDIDYGDDVEPWIGSAAGVGVVGKTDPHPVVALAITDASKARAGVRRLLDCVAEDAQKFHQDPPALGFAVGEKWLVIAADTAEAGRVLASGKSHPLSGDDDYQHWTEAAGDSGILTAYAAPGSLAPLITAATDGLKSDPGSDLGGELGGDLGLGATSWCPGLGDAAGGAAGSSALADFGGAGASLRFNDSGLELEFAGAPGKRSTTARAADISSLPDHVGAAVGLGFADGWVDGLLTGLKQTCGAEFDPAGLYSLISAFTGLDAPADLETLTQRSAQVALGPDLDLEALINSGSPSELPLALRIMGDPSALGPVVDKLGALAPGSTFFDAKPGEDSVTVGFDPTWRDTVAAGGDLGDDTTFRSVVPHASKATSVLYVDLAAIKGSLSALLDDTSVEADLDELSALGASGWSEDGVSHAQLIVRAK